MKRFKFPILLKVILAGLLVSFIASLTAIIVSYNNQVNTAKILLANHIDHTLDDISYYYEFDDSRDQTISDLVDIKTHVQELYEERKLNGEEKKLSDFNTFEEYEEYYKNADGWIFQREGEIGLSKDMLEFRIKYRELLNGLLDARLSSGGVAAYIAYLDDNGTEINSDDRFVFIGDSRMNKHQISTSAFYHVPGTYYELKESDYTSGSLKSKYAQYNIYGRTTRYYDVYSEMFGEDVIATFFIEYDEKAAIASAKEFLNLEIIIMSITAGAIVIIYALLSYFMFVRNVNKLSKASEEISQKLSDKTLTTPFKVDIHSHDEMSNLAASLNALQQAVYDYTNIIEKEASERQKINAELEIASRIQLEALPSFNYDDQQISLRAYMKAAKEVGGDFYDYFYLDESHFVVLIADVSGKGIPASLFMMRCKAVLKSDITSIDNLEEAIYKSNNRLVSSNKENLFVTAFIGIIDTKKNEMTFINAGHEKPYILSNGKINKLDGESNFVIGEIEDFKYKQEKVKFSQGDKIVMFTDGLNESINGTNEEFGYQRIVDNLTRNQNKKLSEIISSINSDLQTFTSEEEAFDDVTIIALSLNELTLTLEYKEKNYTIITKAVDEFENKFSYLPTKVKSEVGIIIDELVNNLVSYDKKEDLTIGFKFEVNKDNLTIKIISDGEDYDPFTNHKDKYLAAENEEQQIGGFGIKIVKDLVDSYKYEYTNNHSIVTLVKKI